MCGRFSLDTTKNEIAKTFKCHRVAYKGQSFNVAPSQSITVVIRDSNRNEAVLMRWGLIPSWVKSLDDWKSNLINARVETIEEKPSFQSGFEKRPCLIPVSGFYEWSQKQPYYLKTERELFALAGIWERWANLETGEQLLSCTILTTQAKRDISDIHHRMPVVVPTEYFEIWLGEPVGRKMLIDSLPEPNLQMYPVSKAVNSPKNDSSDCIEPI